MTTSVSSKRRDVDVEAKKRSRNEDELDKPGNDSLIVNGDDQEEDEH